MGYPTQQQKVDYLFKKIGFTKTKTGVAEDQTSGFSGDTKKAPPNEAIASPLIVPGSSVWSDSSFITTTPPTSDTAYVGVYTTATAYRMTVDTTVANERTFIARQTWGNPSSAIDGDWIDTQFGADYLVKVYMGDPSTGVPGVAYTNLSAAGTSGKDDVWFFDYSSGVLNFNGADLDGQLAGISTDNVYLVGYRYIGRKGIQPPAGIGTFHDLIVSNNLSVGGISTFTGLIDANGIIEATAGQNKIPSLYANYSDLPNANTYHGMFAHVHATGRGYFAHAGNWMELVNKETNGVIGTGTERYNIGPVDATSLKVTGITTLGNIGISTGLITGPSITYIDPATVGDDTGTLVVKGNLQVDGTQTTVNSSTMTVTDKNIELAIGAANDAAADGGGITVKSGDGDKTWRWLNGTDSWTSSDNIRVPDDKVFGFASDTNTHISRPAADTIAFTTGSYERVSIGSTGYINIGGENERKIDITTGDGNSVLIRPNANGSNAAGSAGAVNNMIILRSPYGAGAPTTGNAGARLGMVFTGRNDGLDYSNDPKKSAGIYAVSEDNNQGYWRLVGLSLYTSPYNSNQTERLRISATGNVGIGTSVPTHKLEVDGNTLLKDNLTVSGISTFTDQVGFGTHISLPDNATLSFGHGLDTQIKHDNSNLLITNTTGNIDVTGNVVLNNDLDVDGHTELDNLRVSGISTFGANEITLSNGSLFVQDKIETNGDLRVSGFSTFSDHVTVLGNSTFMGNIDANSDLDVNGHTELDDLNVSGIGTIGSGGSGYAELQYQGVKKLETTSDGVDVFNIIRCLGGTAPRIQFFGDVNGVDTNTRGTFGLATGANQIVHGTGANDVALNTPHRFFIGHASQEVMAKFDPDGPVQLYHDNVKRLETTGIGATVFGQLDTTTLNTGNATFTGTISAGSTTGTDGYYLKTTGVGVTWAQFPTARNSQVFTATAGQTTFSFTYNVNYLDVFVNGVKLPTSEFTANNGTSVVLDDACFVNDTVELITYNTTTSSSASGGAQNLDQLDDVSITGIPVIGETLQHNGSAFVNDYTVSATTTSTSQTAILSLPVATYRSAEYTIQVTEGTKYHVTKVLAIHDGTNVTFNEFGTLTTSTSLSTFALDVNSGNMRLLATPASTNSTVFKVKFTGIKV